MASDSQLAQFFQSCREQFSANTLIHVPTRIAKTAVQLIYTHPLLHEKLHLALSHLGTTKQICAWQLYCCDNVVSDFKIPPPPFEMNQLNGNGLLLNHQSSRFKFHFDVPTQALSLVDLEQKKALYWVKDARAIKWWQTGSPFQVILNVILQQEQAQLTHAAAVATDAGAVLLIGKGGSGKSTTTLNCIHNGFGFVGEDYVVLTHAPPYTVYSIYQSFKLTPQTLALFPHLAAFRANSPASDEKGLYFMSDIMRGNTCLAAPLKAIVQCKVEGELNQLNPATASDILPALSVATMKQLIYTGKPTIDFLATVAKAAPCFKLSLALPLAEIPTLIESCLYTHAEP
ncbi:MAG: hypothetical protein AB7F28_08345 [Candidatus Margulisiibacteriota bacterium]